MANGAGLATHLQLSFVLLNNALLLPKVGPHLLRYSFNFDFPQGGSFATHHS